MGDVVQFKNRIGNKKHPYQKDTFLEQLDILIQMYTTERINKIIIIATGPNEIKACTGNGISMREAKDMCKAFIENSDEYIDKK